MLHRCSPKHVGPWGFVGVSEGGQRGHGGWGKPLKSLNSPLKPHPACGVEFKRLWGLLVLLHPRILSAQVTSQ